MVFGKQSILVWKIGKLFLQSPRSSLSRSRPTMRDSSSPSCSLTVAGDTLRLSLVPFPGPVGFGGCHRSENSPGYMCVYVRKRHEIGYPVCILLIRVWLSDRNSCHDGKNSTSKLPTMRVNCVNGEHVLLDVTLPSKTGVES